MPEKIKAGEVDVNICSFINDDREKYSTFIKTPMGFNENAIFVNKYRMFPFNSWKDLDKKTVGMVNGVSIGQKFDTYVNENARVVRVDTYQQLFKMLSLKRIDALPIGRYTGRSMRDAFGLHDKLVDLNHPILVGKLYISMSKKSLHLTLLPEVEKRLKQAGYYEWVKFLLEKYTQIYSEDAKRNN